MSLDRAWVRRPLVSQPYFGQSVPSVWKESWVTFERPRSLTTKSHGGFTAPTAPPIEFLRCRAHVSLDREPVRPWSNADQPQRRLLHIWIAYPAAGDPDVDFWLEGFGDPQRDDTVVWTSPENVTHRVNVHVVHDPENLHEVARVETEMFE